MNEIVICIKCNGTGLAQSGEILCPVCEGSGGQPQPEDRDTDPVTSAPPVIAVPDTAVTDAVAPASTPLAEAPQPEAAPAASSPQDASVAAPAPEVPNA